MLPARGAGEARAAVSPARLTGPSRACRLADSEGLLACGGQTAVPIRCAATDSDFWQTAVPIRCAETLRKIHLRRAPAPATPPAVVDAATRGRPLSQTHGPCSPPCHKPTSPSASAPPLSSRRRPPCPRVGAPLFSLFRLLADAPPPAASGWRTSRTSSWPGPPPPNTHTPAPPETAETAAETETPGGLGLRCAAAAAAGGGQAMRGADGGVTDAAHAARGSERPLPSHAASKALSASRRLKCPFRVTPPQMPFPRLLAGQAGYWRRRRAHVARVELRDTPERQRDTP